MEITNAVLKKIYPTDLIGENIIIPNDVMVIASNVANGLMIKKITISESVSEISNDAFINNESLEEINIPTSVTSIGERAFFNCKNIRSITLPDSITHIGASAFAGCENLEEIVLPKNIKVLNFRTFADCKRLKRIIISGQLEEISWAVFSGCENLEEIVLPDSVKKIDKQLFLNCKKLKRVVLPNQITELPDEFFKGCSSLDIVLSDNIHTLGNSVFENCPKFTNFPVHVKKFGDKCFKNCKSLDSCILDESVDYLPNGMFDGCIRLSNITYNGNSKLKIGEKCFRNCKSLKSIPTFIANFNKLAFENCISLTGVDVIDSTIPFGCFRGCKNIRIILNQNRIHKLGSFAFSGCREITEISLPNIHIVPAEAFSHCKKLSIANLGIGISRIESRAFYNCKSLREVTLPDCLEVVKKEAFKNCHSIKELTIPANLKSFSDAAFSYMDSLERINVSPFNKTFMTPDHKILINEAQQKLVLYASGSKDTSYSLGDYSVDYDELNRTIIRPISYIGEYAFAGSKNLERLTICTCSTDLEATAFNGCPNLKYLSLEVIPFGSCHGFKLRDHGRYYTEEIAKVKPNIPFEIVEYCGKDDGDIVMIYSNALPQFKKVSKILLPREGSYTIGNDAFSNCHLITEVTIPENAKAIGKNAFPLNTLLKFDNGIETRKLTELIHNTQYIGEYKLYVFSDGTFFIEQGNKIITITKKDIDESCSHSEEIRNNPILFLDFKNDLIDHDLNLKLLFNGILFSCMSLDSRKILFSSLKKDDKFFLEGLKNSGILDKKDEITEYLLGKSNFKSVVDYIELLRKYNLSNPILFSKFLMAKYNIDNFEQLINYDLELLLRTLKDSDLLEREENITYVNGMGKTNYHLTYKVLEENLLARFISYVKKYDIRDRYLFSKHFMGISNNQLADNLFRVYDANIKRLLKSSLVTQNDATSVQNLSDLLILMKITGALEEDPIIRQRASTFICEKIFQETLPNGNSNRHRIVGDDIHRIFNFPYLREEFDMEFANFFLENYQSLLEEERKKSGFIQRVYLNFREISRTCTSDKGSQRKLKVGIEKCKNFLSAVKFDGVTLEKKEFATIIGAWYDNNSAWLNAQKIYNEALTAPRNIFTKITYNELGEPIYDNNPEHDLKEPVNKSFSFEWLPKQAYDNFILGKNCSCCAHLEGAGQGIMRASMILDCCQNLVIRNESGEIIAKATLYVNKEAGYAVFNNVESSLNYRSDDDLNRIYNAFLRGAYAFFETYNENNPDNPILNISIGANRNTILDYLTDDKHPVVDIQQSISYGTYSLGGYRYSGDWAIKQRLVLKR